MEKEPRNDIESSFKVMLYEMDVERIRYLIVSYLRVRLQKIERYHKYIIEHDQLSRLSADETRYIKEFSSLTEQYFESTFFSHFNDSPYVTDDENLNENIRVILNFKRTRDDEMNSPFVNRKKLVSVRIHGNNEPIEIPVEEETESGEMVNIRITNDHLTIVEYDLIEPYLLGSHVFELSWLV